MHGTLLVNRRFLAWADVNNDKMSRSIVGKSSDIRPLRSCTLLQNHHELLGLEKQCSLHHDQALEIDFIKSIRARGPGPW